MCPTEQMADAARGFLLGRDMGNTTFERMREHLELTGYSIDCWPEWAKTALGHIPKESQAMLIYIMMDSARLELTGGGEQPTNGDKGK